MRSNVRPLLGAGILLGMGLGGFFDGIVLHQILQWHHLVCTTAACHPRSVPELQRQNTQDGWFHLFVYLLTISGVAALFRAGGRGSLWSGRVLSGAILVGWGIFNLLEGIIDHHLLQIHHVRPGPDQAAWDAGFLIWGALMLAGGLGLTRPASSR